MAKEKCWTSKYEKKLKKEDLERRKKKSTEEWKRKRTKKTYKIVLRKEQIPKNAGRWNEIRWREREKKGGQELKEKWSHFNSNQMLCRLHLWAQQQHQQQQQPSWHIYTNNYLRLTHTTCMYCALCIQTKTVMHNILLYYITVVWCIAIRHPVELTHNLRSICRSLHLIL